MNRPVRALVCGLFALNVIAPACIPATPVKPNIILVAPPHGSQFREGDTVAIQSVATDSTGIARVELWIDGALARSDAAPSSPTSFNFIQNWSALPGPHTLSVRAYNRAGVASDAASVSISVLPVATPSVPTTSARAVPPPSAVAQGAPTNTSAATRAPIPAPTQTRARATMPAQFQEDTLYEGKKNYNCDARGCWRADGTLGTPPDYFYPDLNANNDEIHALLTSIGLPASRVTDDREKWRRVQTVWVWLSQNVIREGRPDRETAWNYLGDLMKTPKDHWPSIGDLARVFKRYNGLVWGACNSRAFTLATLLYRTGIQPDDLAVVIAQWKTEYSQHLYGVLRIENRWYYLDPTCSESHPALSAAPENVGCNTADHTHPNTINPLPGSTLPKPMLVR